MEMIDFFSSVSVLIALISFVGVISLIAWLLTYTIKRSRRTSGASRAVKAWGGLSLILALLGIFSYKAASISVTQEVNRIIESPGLTILVDGVEVENKIPLIDGFKSKITLKQSGSYPTDIVKVRFKDDKASLDFELKRDSRDRDLYWVYYPNYKTFADLFYVKVVEL